MMHDGKDRHGTDASRLLAELGYERTCKRMTSEKWVKTYSGLLGGKVFDEQLEFILRDGSKWAFLAYYTEHGYGNRRPLGIEVDVMRAAYLRLEELKWCGLR